MRFVNVLDNPIAAAALSFIGRNPGASVNRIYVNVMPACVNNGRSKSFGTQKFDTLNRLVKEGFVTCKTITWKGPQKPDETSYYYEYRCRRLRRYQHTLTKKGREALASLNIANYCEQLRQESFDPLFS